MSSNTVTFVGAMLAKVAASYDLPDYVLQATPEELTPPDASDPRHYAQRGERLDYPIHNKVACWMSAARFSLEEDRGPVAQPVIDNLVKRAAYFGIAQDLNACFQKSVQQEKSASETTDESFPVRNREEALAAQSWLLKHAGTDAINSFDANELANKIYYALNAEVDPMISKIAGFGSVSDVESFARSVGGRWVVDGLIPEGQEDVAFSKRASVELTDHDLVAINQNLHGFVKVACKLSPTGTPWDMVQYTEPVYLFDGQPYLLSQFDKVADDLMNQCPGVDGISRRVRVEQLAKNAGEMPEAFKKSMKVQMGSPGGKKKDTCSKCDGKNSDCTCKTARCWKGYEPVPGKAPYSEDSCQPKTDKSKKKKDAKEVPQKSAVDYRKAASGTVLASLLLNTASQLVEE